MDKISEEINESNKTQKLKELREKIRQQYQKAT
jgi:hypothetical protein